MATRQQIEHTYNYLDDILRASMGDAPDLSGMRNAHETDLWKGIPMRVRVLAAVAVLMLAATAGCGTPRSLFGPTPGPWTIEGYTWDDSGFAPPPHGPRVDLEGVRVEVMDGPRAGIFAISDNGGRYRGLTGMPAGPVQLRATKDGYDPVVQTVTICPDFGCNSVSFTLGQPPHILWGDVLLTVSSGRVTIADVRLEILDGPNAGKVTFSDAAGQYRFDDLVASPAFSIRLTKTGYQTQTRTIIGSNCFVQPCSFRHNTLENMFMALLPNQ